MGSHELLECDNREVLSPIIEGATTNELRFLLAMSSEKGEAKTSAIVKYTRLKSCASFGGKHNR